VNLLRSDTLAKEKLEKLRKVNQDVNATSSASSQFKEKRQCKKINIKYYCPN